MVRRERGQLNAAEIVGGQSVQFFQSGHFEFRSLRIDIGIVKSVITNQGGYQPYKSGDGKTEIFADGTVIRLMGEVVE